MNPYENPFNLNYNYLMRRYTRILIVILFVTSAFSFESFSQCPASSFTVNGSVCSGQSIPVTNTSTNATSFVWDFCGGDFATTPVGADDPSNPPSPVSMSVVFDGTNWFGFLVNNNNHLFRYDFGNTLDTIPIGPVDLGVPAGLLGTLFNEMSFHHEGNKWYALFGVTNGYQVMTLDFDTSLTNPAPSASAFTDQVNFPSNLAMQDLEIDHDSIFLFIGNDANSPAIITVLSYGTSILNTPAIDTIKLSGYNNVEDIALVKTCDHWYGYAISYSSSTIIKLDFGVSLHNKPQYSDLGNPNNTLITPFSIVLANDGMEWAAFVMNYGSSGNLIKIDMGTDIANPVLSGSPLLLPTVSGLGNSVNIAKEGSAFYLFPAGYTSGKFSKIKYETPCSAVPQTTTDAGAVGATYTSGGTYHISLTASDVNGNSSIYYDSAIVGYAPVTNYSFQNFCLGDTTVFHDSTTLSVGTITGYHWDFGDGDTSNLQSPTHTYLTANSYTVTLTASASSGCSASMIQTINITPRPIASCVLPNGCSNTVLSFTDSSTIPAGTISSWLWQFGNGDSSVDQNPFYGYPAGGSFQVTLTATSAAGCSDDTTLSLNISPSPVAGFATTNTCVGQTVIFSDETVSQINIISYSWDFGDGGTSSLSNPTNVYTSGASATYNVTLIVQASNLCSDTLIVPVHVSNPPTANFSYLPSNACQGNDVMFTDLSSGNGGDTISSWAWDFADGNVDSVMNPSHLFTVSDTFHVTLIAYSPSSCPSAPYSQDIIVIQSPIASFGYNDACLGDVTQFNDVSIAPNGSSIIDRFWQFDDGDSSHLTNPSHLFTTDGAHTVVLTVTTNFGCTSTDTAYVAVHAHPHAAYTYQNACTDFPTIFTSNSTADSASYIAFYQWDFGDPGSANNTSGLQSPSHTYDSSATGPHNVFLIIQNNFGCRDSVIQTINVNFSVLPNFNYSPTCIGDIMSFTNFSGNANLDSLWTWNFGDGQGTSISNPSHYYVYAGTYTVTLTALSESGCLSTGSKDIVVSAIPVAAFSAPPACIHGSYQLSDSSTVTNGSIVRWQWAIDTLETDTIQNPVYSFDTTGTFPVKLIVYSNIGCVDSVQHNVIVHELPVPNFSFTPQYGNPPLDVAFTNLTDISSTYSWNFGDNTSSSASPSPHHDYQDTGRYVIHLIATSLFGCVDSATKNIYVIKPLLDAAVTNVTATLINNQLSIQANIANLGTVDIDSVIMQAQLQDGTVIQEMYHQLLPNGSNGIQSYNFVARFNIPPSSSVAYYCVSAIKPNDKDDDVQSNNEKCSTLRNEFSVIEPHPNPFTGSLDVSVVLPFDDYLTVELYDNLGQKLSTLFDRQAVAGLNLIHSDLFYLADGLYTLRFSFRDQDVIRKVMKESVKK